MKFFKKLIATAVACVTALTVFAFTACGPDDPNKPSGGKNTQLIEGVLSQQNEFVQFNVSFGKEQKYDMTINLDTQNFVVDGLMVISDLDETNDEYTPAVASYLFLREGESFSAYFSGDVKDKLDIKDFSEYTLSHDASILDSIPEEFAPLVSAVVAEGINYANYYLLSLFDAFDALTVDGDSAVADVNLLAYNAISGVNKLISSLDETSTLGDLLKSDVLRKILSPATSLITPAELKATLLGLVEGLGIGELLETLNIDLSELLGNPAANGDTYDYILELLDSEAVMAAIIAIMQNMQSEGEMQAPSSFAKMPLSGLLAMAGTDLETVQAMIAALAEGVKESSFAFSMGDGAMKISNAKIEYTFADGAIAEQRISADVVQVYGETTKELPVEVTVKYNIDYTFADIGNCKVEERNG